MRYYRLANDDTHIDVIVFPEMTLSGYVFKSLEEILPFVEECPVSSSNNSNNYGPMISWARSIATKYQCHVQFGFPEKQITTDTTTKYYNSIAFISPSGEILHVYRKHFLYETDENWANEGESFSSITIPSLSPSQTVGFGICMDVNPYKFQADFEEFEFASFHSAQNSNLLFMSMNWLQSETFQPLPPLTPSFETIKYWIIRLIPLLDQTKEDPEKEIIAVVSNRIGVEEGVAFIGSSCVLRFNQGKPELLGALGWNEESVLVVET